MVGAALEVSALMGSGATGDAQAASSGKAGGGGKGGEGGALRGAPVVGCRALASCSRRIWFCSCWIFRGSLWSQGCAPPGGSPLPVPSGAASAG